MIDANRLRNTFRRDAAQSTAYIQDGPCQGIVTSFDPATQSAKVRLEPYGVETGYLPVKTAWAGPGWGLFSPPSQGDLVDVHFEGGSLDTGHINGRAHNDVDKPLPCPSGEMWLVHKSGSQLKFTNDGKVLLGASGDGVVMLGNADQMKRLMKEAALEVYNSHTHPTPKGDSGPPHQQLDPAVHLTQETKAS